MDTGSFDGIMDLSYDEYRNLNITKKNAKNPPFKDTAVLPFPGYVRFRFRASNPGFWLFHCHYDWHMPIGWLFSFSVSYIKMICVAGMALIVQVGELHEMKSAPNDFPTCHNFLSTRLT